MAKKRTSKNSSGSFHIAYIFLVLIFAAGITFLALSMIFPQKLSEDDELSTAVNNTTQKTDADSANEDDSNDESDAEKAAEAKTPKQNEDESDTPADSINASITMNEINSGKYMLRITIYELLNSGTCELYMENANGSSVSRSAKIVATGADSSSCQGFDIPTSGIDGGTYGFTVKLKSGNKSNTIKGTIKI